jgi:hypothetical protein
MIDLVDPDVLRKLVWLEGRLPANVRSLSSAGRFLKRLRMWDHDGPRYPMWTVVESLVQRDSSRTPGPPALEYLRFDVLEAATTLPKTLDLSPFSNLRDLLVPLDLVPDGLFVLNSLQNLSALLSVTFSVHGENFYGKDMSFWPVLPKVTRLGVQVYDRAQEAGSRESVATEKAFLAKFPSTTAWIFHEEWADDLFSSALAMFHLQLETLEELGLEFGAFRRIPDDIVSMIIEHGPYPKWRWMVGLYVQSETGETGKKGKKLWTRFRKAAPWVVMDDSPDDSPHQSSLWKDVYGRRQL